MKKEKLNNQLIDIAESLLGDDHVLNFNMHGNSMYPTMREGDTGQVVKCLPDELKNGDIVVFKQHGKLVAHRLIAVFHQKDVRMFVAKGDKNYQKDAPFTEQDIIGTIVSIERKGKTIKVGSSSMRYRYFMIEHFSKMLIPVYDLQLRVKSHFFALQKNLKEFSLNLKLIAGKSGKLLITNSVIAVLQGILPFLIIVCVKALIDQLTKSTASGFQHPHVFIAMLIGTALVFLASGILSEISSYYLEKLSQSVSQRVYALLHSQHALLDLSNYENYVKQDKMHRAVQEASYRPVKILNELLMGVKSVASALFLMGLFISIRWYLVFILLVAIAPGVLLRLKISRKLYRLKESQSTKEREMYYYNRILTGFPFAKELRLFGFAGFFEHRFKTTQDTLFSQKIELRKSEIRLGILAQLFAVILIFLSLGLVSYLKMTNEISIGTVVLFFVAFQRGYSVLNEFFRSITQILEDNTFLKDFTDFLNIRPQLELPAGTEQAFSLQKEIRFENVSFRYETSQRDALKSVSLTIPAQKTVAFVGANGSGKTTMIKLLCGFYSPDSGNIYFDETNALAIGQKAVCRNITAVFQDFALYNISASENIELGNIQINSDMERTRNAAAAAGINGVLENLPEKYDTMLGTLFKGGEELSIGQWQKMAIARAFYRDSPLLLMDEPSSALDAGAELQIINTLKKLSHNKTAVIISHRLSTVQWADLIYFFDRGEVMESGSHEELMNLKGKYYSLFLTTKNEM